MPSERLLHWRYRLEAGLMRLACWGLPLLPLEWLRGLAWSLGTVVWLLDARGRATAMANIQLAFPELSPAACRRHCRHCYQGFSRAFAELFWAKNLRAEDIDNYATFHFASAETEQAVAAGAVLATPHAGNFEWLSHLCAFRGITCLIVAENFKNPALTEIFRTLRQTTGQQIIPQEGAVLKMFKHLRRGGRVALLTDLTAPPEQSATVIRCFGKATCVTMAHAALAQRSQRPIVPVITVPLHDGRYEIRFLPPISVSPTDSLQAATQATWDAFEPVIRAQPAMWLWIYKHWRYLPADEVSTAYPAYANRSKKFDKLLRLLP